MKFCEKLLKDRFTTVPGVGYVLGGYTIQPCECGSNPDQLKTQYCVSDIIDAIQTEHSELPGGNVEDAKKNFNVRTMGEATSVKEFESLVISRRASDNWTSDPKSNGSNFHKWQKSKKDLMNCRLSRFNGISALGLGSAQTTGSNAVAVAKAVSQNGRDTNYSYPLEMNLAVNFDSTLFYRRSSARTE